MKITIAHALKEKNRLSTEIEQMWRAFQNENSCLETHKRKIDVKKTLKTIGQYSSKLVELKTKIGNASSAEHLRNIHLLDETKNRLAKLAETDGSEDPEFKHPDRRIERTAVFNEKMILAMQQQLQSEANHLQDKIDVFNAETKIDFESPLA